MPATLGDATGRSAVGILPSEGLPEALPTLPLLVAVTADGLLGALSRAAVSACFFAAAGFFSMLAALRVLEPYAHFDASKRGPDAIQGKISKLCQCEDGVACHSCHTNLAEAGD